MMLRVALTSMSLLCGCAGTGTGAFLSGLVENAARSACRDADNCEDRCANGAVVEHSRAICVVDR